MAHPQQPTEGLVKGEHDEAVLGRRPLPSGPQGVGESVTGGREERISEPGEEKGCWADTHSAPQRQPDLRGVGWPASECPSRSSPTPGHCPDTGPPPGPSLVCVPWRHVSNSPICLASVEEREAGASSTYWAGYGSCVSPARSKPDLPLCQGSAAPLSPILDGSSGQPPLNGLLASLDVLMLFPEHMLVFWSTDRLPHLTSQSPAVLLLSGSLAGSSRPDFPILSLKPHRP